MQNAVPLRAWAEAVRDGRPAVDKGIALSDEDRLRRDVIERLMCDMAVDLSAEAARYGKTADSFRSEIEMLEPMIADGIATIDGDRISITEPGTAADAGRLRPVRHLPGQRRRASFAGSLRWQRKLAAVTVFRFGRQSVPGLGGQWLPGGLSRTLGRPFIGLIFACPPERS